MRVAAGEKTMWHWLQQSLWVRLARAELNVLRYALVPPRHRPDRQAQEFFMTRDATQMAWAFVAIALIEALAFHLLLGSLGSKAIIAILIFADVFILYAIGFVRSLPRLPAISLWPDGRLIVQAGVLFRLETHISALAQVADTPIAAAQGRAFRGALLSNPNCVLVFNAPQKARIFSLFPLHRSVITLKINDVARLRDQVAQMTGQPQPLPN